MFTINPDALIKDVNKTDLIIIPAIHGNPAKVYESNKEFIPWIINQYKNGAEIVSFCIGAFFLASTGLLKDKQCTTHWASANEFKKITIEQLADMLALSRRSLERRFKKATSNTVNEYIHRVKIEAAKMSLESSRNNINEVMYKVGYADPKAFRVTFKRITGLSPIQYRNKYNREYIA